MTVNILGTPYMIQRAKPWEDAGLIEADGYCDDSVKKIVVVADERSGPDQKADIGAVRKKQLRHEIVHAFLSESGLAENSDWAQNEEIVDWIAIQLPKLIKAMREEDALDDAPMKPGNWYRDRNGELVCSDA